MFQIQAAIAAVHADATIAEATDWRQVVALYDQLYVLRPDPVVAINRAVAIGALDGPGALPSLELIDADAVAAYQPFHAARADLLARCGRTSEADSAYERAIELTNNPVERRFLDEQRTGGVELEQPDPRRSRWQGGAQVGDDAVDLHEQRRIVEPLALDEIIADFTVVLDGQPGAARTASLHTRRRARSQRERGRRRIRCRGQHARRGRSNCCRQRGQERAHRRHCPVVRPGDASMVIESS